MFTNLSVSVILLLLRENIVNYIYIFATYYALSQCLYWTTYEAMIYDLIHGSEFKKYFSYSNIITNMSAIFFPVLFGIIIANYSYILAFGILSIIATISFALSFTIKGVEIDYQIVI